MLLMLMLALVLLVSWVVVGMAAVCYFRVSSRTWRRWWCSGVALALAVALAVTVAVTVAGPLVVERERERERERES